MKVNNLNVRLCRTRRDDPLAIIDGLPGLGAGLTSKNLRDLAKTFNEIADDAENCNMATDKVYQVTNGATSE